MLSYKKNGLSPWAIIVVVLVIIALIGKCSNKLHKRQEIILPSYSSFKMDGRDCDVYFQTFDSQNMASLNFFWETGKSADRAVYIKNSNELFDSNDSSCGYIVVNKDGTFDIKGWSEANGHYVGLDGARMRMKMNKRQESAQLRKEADELQKEMKLLKDSVSYLVGINFGSFIKQNDFGDINYDDMVKGMKDYVNAKGNPNDPEFGSQFKIDPSILENYLETYLNRRKDTTNE